MKKTTLRMLWCSLLACMAVLGLPSCSGNADADAFTDEILDTYVSKDNYTVLSFDLTHVIENSGCTVSDDKVQLSSDIRSLINKYCSSREAEEVTRVLEMPGINPGRCVFVMDIADDNEKVALFMALSSEDKFCQMLQDSGFDQDPDYNGYKVMASGRTYILIKDNKAYMTSARSAESSVAMLDQLKEEAARAPLTAWQKDLLSDDDAMAGLLNMSVLHDQILGSEAQQFDSMCRTLGMSAEKISTGYLVYKLDVEGDKAEGKYGIVDNDNHPITSSLIEKKVDTSLLKYANSTHRIVAMGALDGTNDWPGIFTQMVNIKNGYDFEDAEVEAPDTSDYDWEDYDYWHRVQAQREREEAALAGEYMKYVDGTVMIAVGYTEGTNLIMMADEEYAMKHITAAVAAQMAPGKASELLALLRSQLDSEGVPYEFSGSHLKISVEGLTLEVKNQGGVLLAAYNQPISDAGGCMIEKSVFEGSNYGIAMKIEKNNPLLGIVGADFGIEAEMIYKDGEVKAELELEDASKPLLATVLYLVNKY